MPVACPRLSSLRFPLEVGLWSWDVLLWPSACANGIAVAIAAVPFTVLLPVPGTQAELLTMSTRRRESQAVLVAYRNYCVQELHLLVLRGCEVPVRASPGPLNLKSLGCLP
jgi:hypothetical protein